MRYKILVMDDEIDNLQLLKRTFRKDHIVFASMSGEEGLQIIESNHVDLIITDQRMPGMLGTEFLERTIEKFPDTIRIILTGYTEVSDLIEAINSGRVYRYVTKPWNPEELRLIVKQALESYQLTLDNRQLLKDLQEQVDRWQDSLQKERYIRTVFQKYVPAEVVNEVLKRDANLMLVGNKRKVSILFADIKNSTCFAENNSPEKVVTVLNEFFSEMSKIVVSHKGIVDKFLGDAIMAVFGAPISHEDDVRQSLLAAKSMLEKLKTLNEKLQTQGMEKFEISISINTGESIVGNIGSAERMDYTVIGDTVNTAARMGKLTGHLTESSVLLGKNTYECVKDLVEVKEWPSVELKGKKEKVQVYEVVKFKF